MPRVIFHSYFKAVYDGLAEIVGYKYDFIEITSYQVKEGFENRINLYRDRGLNAGPPAQTSDTLPLDHQIKPKITIQSETQPKTRIQYEIEPGTKIQYEIEPETTNQSEIEPEKTIQSEIEPETTI
uniref:Uncharacterized protein n=1 Tax=Timema cristinae TaxID=61476 RepID=A0A7R9H3D1_TIMCR|nr:unnamed protein product [Timema cristinae]